MNVLDTITFAELHSALSIALKPPYSVSIGELSEFQMSVETDVEHLPFTLNGVHYCDAKEYSSHLHAVLSFSGPFEPLKRLKDGREAIRAVAASTLEWIGGLGSSSGVILLTFESPRAWFDLSRPSKHLLAICDAHLGEVMVIHDPQSAVRILMSPRITEAYVIRGGKPRW